MAEVPAQTVSLPLMEAGAGGVPTQTARLVAGESPQAFEAATVTFPPFESAVARMEVESEAPDHPLGRTQV
jgi:hypothetical protein